VSIIFALYRGRDVAARAEPTREINQRRAEIMFKVFFARSRRLRACRSVALGDTPELDGLES
jgi:hypothetical protein